VFDLDRVSPGNVIDRNAESGGQALALHGAGRIVSAHNSFDYSRVQPGSFHKLANIDPGLFHVAHNGLHDDWDFIISLSYIGGR